MRSIHITSGGRDGALLITERGARPVLPLPDGVLATLRSVNELCRAVRLTPDKGAREKLQRSLTALTNLAVGRVESAVGPLEGDLAILFQDDDGGFTCGSTGKPPLPFPWPPSPLPDIGALINEGVLDRGVVGLVGAAREKGMPLARVFENPATAAKELGVEISKKGLADLEAASPSRLKDVKDPVDREILGFFHKVVAEGKSLDSWYREPLEVSDRLKVKLSPAAVEKIISGEISGGFSNPGWRADVGTSVIIIAVADTVIIAIVATPAKRTDLSGIIRDRSGLMKI